MVIVGAVNDVYEFRQRNSFNGLKHSVDCGIMKIKTQLEKAQNEEPITVGKILEEQFKELFKKDGPVHLLEQEHAVTYSFLNEENGDFSFNNIEPMPESLSVSDSSLGWIGASVLLSEEEQKRFVNSRHSFFGEDSLRNNYKRAQEDYEKKGLKWDKPYSKENYAFLLKEFCPEALEFGQIYIDNFNKYGSCSWYDWSVKNWGTKWGAMDVSTWNGEDVQSHCSVVYSTAWSPSIPICKKIASDYNVSVVCGYHDEGGNFSGVSVIVPKGWKFTQELLDEYKVFNSIVDESNEVDEIEEIFAKDCEGQMRGVLGGIREYGAFMKKVLSNQPRVEKRKDVLLKIKLKALMEREVKFSDPIVKALIEKNGNNYGSFGAEWFFLKLLSECKSSDYFWDCIKELQKQKVIDIFKPIMGHFSIALLWANEGFAEGVVYAKDKLKELAGKKASDDYLNCALVHNVLKNRVITIEKLKGVIKKDFYPNKIDYKVAEHLTGTLYSLSKTSEVSREYVEQLLLFGEEYLAKNPKGLTIVCNMVRHEHAQLCTLKEAFVLEDVVDAQTGLKKKGIML